MRIDKILWGLLFSFAVGFGCALARIPVPSPPVFSGAVLVFMMSTGYWLVDRYLARRAKAAEAVAERAS